MVNHQVRHMVAAVRAPRMVISTARSARPRAVARSRVFMPPRHPRHGSDQQEPAGRRTQPTQPGPPHRPPRTDRSARRGRPARRGRRGRPGCGGGRRRGGQSPVRSTRPDTTRPRETPGQHRYRRLSWRDRRREREELFPPPLDARTYSGQHGP
ncbi:hypothetical protein Ae505Ps2_6325 [Pseudonocardia sp. Ae505_Ps2]|nr:hypothetical protein Ae505Ps2_6325 [Pseudonocardia sp. Ae505_Ps2]